MSHPYVPSTHPLLKGKNQTESVTVDVANERRESKRAVLLVERKLRHVKITGQFHGHESWEAGDETDAGHKLFAELLIDNFGSFFDDCGQKKFLIRNL